MKMLKLKKEFLKEYPKYTVERLEHSEEIRGEARRKTFYVDEPQPNGNQLVILSFGKESVVINSGILIDDEVRISKTPTPFKFNTLYSEEEQEFKEFNYTPNMKRDICVIDPETTEELKPRLYYDENEDKANAGMSHANGKVKKQNEQNKHDKRSRSNASRRRWQSVKVAAAALALIGIISGGVYAVTKSDISSTGIQTN